jgi:hypothetical protein
MNGRAKEEQGRVCAHLFGVQAVVLSHSRRSWARGDGSTQVCVSRDGWRLGATALTRGTDGSARGNEEAVFLLHLGRPRKRKEGENLAGLG